MKTLISKYEYNAADSEEIRIDKSLILIISVFCSFCALAWSGIYYSVFGFGLTTVIPLIFIAVVIPSIFISHFACNYKILIYISITCITIVPMLVQFSLGSIHDSGFVIIWCFLGPLGALLFLNAKHAKIWMLIFVLIVGITVIVVPTFSMDGAQVTENTSTIFFLMNTGGSFLLIFISTKYFLKGLANQKEISFSLLQRTKEKGQMLEEALEREKELGELKTSFVQMASHQFRTPLALIQSNAELLEIIAHSIGKEEVEKCKKATDRITGAIASMTELMDDVLVLGKLTTGNVQYEPQDVDLVFFCEKLVREFNNVPTDKRVINFVTTGEPYKVWLDPKLLTQSLSNLISNAFKYSFGKENPELTIHFKPKELVLSIKDYGIGIPKEELLKLFQPFFRANNVIEIKGTGLGLSIAKEYVEINKGQIEAKSKSGEGSCFEIKFNR
jgi:signal transduction histidine kinase